jgi:hypothetical protein
VGAKTWMLAYTDGKADLALKANPELDRPTTAAVAKRLFPSETLRPMADGDLAYTCPPDNEVHLGCFPGLTIVAAKEFGIDNPSKLDVRFLDFAKGRTVYLHAMHSAVDWFAYAVWIDGKLERSLSLSPDSGIVEDIGQRRAFEEPFWSGMRPVFEPGEEDGDYPFQFHPLELGEAALQDLFGYQLEGMIDPSNIELEAIPLMCFERKKAWWKFS